MGECSTASATRRGKIRPVLAGDHGEHHVERRGAAGTGEAVPVDFKQAARGVDVREGFREARQVLPMDGAFIVVENAGFRQQMGAGADRTDVIAAARRLAQPADQPLVRMVLHIEAGADDDGGMRRNRLEIAVDHGENVVGGGHRLAVHRMHGPAVKRLFRHAVCQPQGLNGRGHRHHGEFRHQNRGRRAAARPWVCRQTCPSKLTKEVLANSRHHMPKAPWSDK